MNVPSRSELSPFTRLRHAYGASVESWARLFRVAPRTISRWENSAPPREYVEPIISLGRGALENGFMGFNQGDLRTLEDVIRHTQKKANMARELKDARLAEILEDVKRLIEEGARDLLVWLTEPQAELWTGKKQRWLRREYDELEKQGHAQMGPNGVREYRRIVLRRRSGYNAAVAGGALAVKIAQQKRAKR